MLKKFTTVVSAIVLAVVTSPIVAHGDGVGNIPNTGWYARTVTEGSSTLVTGKVMGYTGKYRQGSNSQDWTTGGAFSYKKVGSQRGGYGRLNSTTSYITTSPRGTPTLASTSRTKETSTVTASNQTRVEEAWVVFAGLGDNRRDPWYRYGKLCADKSWAIDPCSGHLTW